MVDDKVHDIKPDGVQVALVSNLYPTVRANFGGVFISERILAHRALGNEIMPFAVTPRYSAIVRTLRGRSKVRGERLPVSALYREARAKVDLGKFARSRFLRPPVPMLRRFAADIAKQLDGKVDIVHAHGMYMFAAGGVARELSKMLGVPFVVTLHGSDINVYLDDRRRLFYREILSEASTVIAVSSSLLEVVASKGITLKNTTVIPNGVDVDVFGSMFSKPRSNNTRIAFVGNLERVKGADRLPAIFRQIASRELNVVFDIVGQGELEHQLKAECAGLTVDFHGELGRTEVAQVMRQATLMLMPSRSEGWPTVVLEAHAAGTPVIGTDVGGLPEAIGDQAFVVPDGTGLEFVMAERAQEVIHSFVDHLPPYQRAVKHTWHHVAERETVIYNEALSR